MVARAFAETSGKTWSRTSPRARADAEVLGAFAGGNVLVRTEAGVGVATCEVCGCAAVFFPAAVFSEFCVAGGADFFGAGVVSRRAGCSTGICWAAVGADVAEVDDEESDRWPRIFGNAKMATRTRRTAATGTT